MSDAAKGPGDDTIPPSRLTFYTTESVTAVVGGCITDQPSEIRSLMAGFDHLELQFLSPAISDVTLDKDVASGLLGADLTASYNALVADIRDALFLGELPDSPIVSHQHGNLHLSYRIEGDTFLEVEPIGKSIVRQSEWQKAFRVRLRNITSAGKVLI